MVRRQIEIDEETDQILRKLAQQYGGDLNKALMDLVHAHEGIETIADECEAAHGDSLLEQRERSERSFREGRTTTWDEVKRRNRL